MVGVGVGIDHGSHWAISEMLGDQFIASACSVFNGERINDHPTRLTFDESDI